MPIIIQATVFNINDRPEFEESQKIKLSIYDCRVFWVSELEEVMTSDYSHMMTDTFNNLKMGPAELKKYIQQQWNRLRTDGVYEIDYFGDLLMQAVARGTKKKILIFNTDKNSLNDPIVVVSPETFGGTIDSDVPVVVCYNGNHYAQCHKCNFDLMSLTNHTQSDCSIFSVTRRCRSDGSH